MIVGSQAVPSPEWVAPKRKGPKGPPKRELLFAEVEVDWDPNANHGPIWPWAIRAGIIIANSGSCVTLWYKDEIRAKVLQYLERDDLLNLRLVCSVLGKMIAPVAFRNICITFTTTTFSKGSRLAALERIGEHVKMLTFNVPHTPDSFLPPIVDSKGEERHLVYEPQTFTPTTLGGRLRQPKYGSWEMNNLLIYQYPPLFHAATNVSNFIRAFSALPRLAHLRIHTPGQPQPFGARKSTVDYALISLRIALERAPLAALQNLTLTRMHASSLLHLQPVLGFGASPAGQRRWRQIERLRIEMESFAFGDGKGLPNEHLKILHSYIRTFAPSLRSFVFKWLGDDKGPSPLALHLESYLQVLPAHPALRTSGDAPAPCSASSGLEALSFPRLLYVEVENAVTAARHVSDFVLAHHAFKLAEFKFENMRLSEGTWDDALAALTTITGGEDWKARAVEEGEVVIGICVDELDRERWKKSAAAAGEGEGVAVRDSAEVLTGVRRQRMGSRCRGSRIGSKLGQQQRRDWVWGVKEEEPSAWKVIKERERAAYTDFLERKEDERCMRSALAAIAQGNELRKARGEDDEMRKARKEDGKVSPVRQETFDAVRREVSSVRREMSADAKRKREVWLAATERRERERLLERQLERESPRRKRKGTGLGGCALEAERYLKKLYRGLHDFVEKLDKYDL